MSGKIKKVDHIGIAVTDLEEAIALYTHLFGAGPVSIEDVPDQKVRTAFFQAGETNLELLYPTSDNSPISKFLAKRGPGIHHICFEVAHLESALEECKQAGMRLVDATPRMGAHEKRIAFLHPASTGGVLLELSEDSGASTCARHPRAPHTVTGQPPHSES